MNQVYVSHWTPLLERKAYLDRALREQNIEANWFTEFDQRTLSPELVKAFYRPDPVLFAKRSAAGGALGIAPRYYELCKAEIANAINHIHILKDFVRSGAEVALILEDDVLLCPDFSVRLQAYIDQLPADWDMLYPGSGANLHLYQSDSDRNVYRHPGSQARTADSYLLTRSAAEKILSTLTTFALPIDWELNYHQALHGLNVYWGEPSLTAQGSEVGLYRSTVAARA